MSTRKDAIHLKAKPSHRFKATKACSPWLANLSNKVLPPFFFLLIGVFALVLASYASSDLTRLNLGLLSAFSGAIGFYFLGS